MNDQEKNPNTQNFENVDDGLDDDLDVPTYRKLADTDPTMSAVPDAETVVAPAAVEPEQAPTNEPEATEPDEAPAPKRERRGDPYRAAGRAAPQVIAPLAAAKNYKEADADFAGPTPSTGVASDTSATSAATETAMADFSADKDSLADADAATTIAPAGAAGAGARDVDKHDLEDAPTQMYSAESAAAVGATTGLPLAADDSRGGLEAERSFDDSDADFYDEELDARRGTIDFGLLILRLGVGGLLLFHGLATFFALGGNGGMGALESQFTAANFNYAGILATAIPTVQVIAGGLLILGLATPLGASLALALSMFVTMFEAARGGAILTELGNSTSGIQGPLALTIAALALQFTGPGKIGLDFSRGWSRRPMASSWIFCIVAIAVAVAGWYFTTGKIPFMN